MREIKFRARDTEGKWIYSKPMPDMGFWKWVQYDDTTISNEWTGLLDCNGREIYEGDIVKSYGFYNTEVKWHETNQSLVGYTGGFHLVANPDKLEVIGNIYENPELLK